MEYIWQKEKVFMKDLIDSFPDPRPANTTVATLLKRMTYKGVTAITSWVIRGSTIHWLKSWIIFQNM